MTAAPRQVLALLMQENDAGAATIGEYLITLLALLWNEKEGFDGKKPFGNSDWDGEVVETLVRAGLVAGTVDEDGNTDDWDWDMADELIAAAIRALGTEERAAATC